MVLNYKVRHGSEPTFLVIVSDIDSKYYERTNLGSPNSKIKYKNLGLDIVMALQLSQIKTLD